MCDKNIDYIYSIASEIVNCEMINMVNVYQLQLSPLLVILFCVKQVGLILLVTPNMLSAKSFFFWSVLSIISYLFECV